MAETARQRWKILCDAVVHNKVEPSKFSIRRFGAFGLFSIKPLSVSSKADANDPWWIYRSSNFPEFYITHVETGVALKKLQGFNNTGNVCIWPSEEVLAYYCAKHSPMFEGKGICELGGGMSCLAGISLALVCSAKEILLTDGNEVSIKNIEKIIERNSALLKASHVHSRLLKWENEMDFEDLKGSFDFVISADCLFFKSLHHQMLKATFQLLKPGGRAILMAPRRHDTFHDFARLSQSVMDCEIIENYDSYIWELHTKKREEGKEFYDENIHYPLMLAMKKRT